MAAGRMMGTGYAAAGDSPPGAPKPTPVKWERSRKLYEGEPLTLREIAAIEGITTQALHLRRQQCGWTPRRRGAGQAAMPDASPADAEAAPTVGAGGDRSAVLRRLWGLLERQIGGLAGAAQTGGTAQELASLARTLERLIETGRDLGGGGEAAEEGPVDIDEFRDEIARRLEGLLEGRPDG